jgi:hypothetical protein
VEFDNNRKQIEEDYEEKLMQEKRKMEELRTKMLREQNEIDSQLDRL